MSTQNKSFFSFGMAVFFAFILNLLIERQVGAFDPDEQSELMELRATAQRVLEERTIDVLSRSSAVRYDYQGKIEKLFLDLGTLTGLNTAASSVRLSRGFHVNLLSALFKEQGVLLSISKRTSDVLLRIAQNRALIPLIKARIKKYWPQEEVLKGTATADIESLETLDERFRTMGSEGFIAPAGIQEQKSVAQTMAGMLGLFSSRVARACEPILVDTRGLAALSVSPRDIRPVLETLDTLYAASIKLKRSLSNIEIKAINPSLTLTFKTINANDDRDSTLNAWGYTFLLATMEYFGETIKRYPEYQQSLEVKRHEAERAEQERSLYQKRLEQQHRLVEEQERYQRTLQEQQLAQEVSAGSSAPTSAPEPASSSSAASAQQDLASAQQDLEEAEGFSVLVQKEIRLYQTHERLRKTVDEEVYAFIAQLAGVSSLEEKIREISSSFKKLMESSEETIETDAVQRNKVFQEANYSAQLKTFGEVLAETRRGLIENYQVIFEFLTSTPKSETEEYYAAYAKYIEGAESMLADLESTVLQAHEIRESYAKKLQAIGDSIDEIKRVFDDRLEEIALADLDDFSRGIERLRVDNEQLSADNKQLSADNEQLSIEIQEERSKRELFEQEVFEREAVRVEREFDEDLDRVSNLQKVVRNILPFDVLAGLIQRAFQKAAEVFREEDTQETAEYYLEEEQSQMPSVISAIQQEVKHFFEVEHEKIVAPLERVWSVMREITSPVPELDKVLRTIEELVEAHQEEITRVVLDPVRATANRLPEALPALVHSALVNHLVYNKPLEAIVGAIQHSQKLVQDAPDMIDTYHRNNNTAGKQAAAALRTIASQVGTLSSAAVSASFSTSNSEVSTGNAGAYKDLFNDLAERLDESQRTLAALPRKTSAEILRRLEPVTSHHKEVMQPKRTRGRSTMKSGVGISGTLLEVTA